MTPGQSIAATVSLLAASNVFMTFAWYGHLNRIGLASGVTLFKT